MQMKITPFFLFSSLVIILSCCVLAPAPVSSAPSIEQCNDEISKVGQCLGFATGKADKPTKECCDSVKDIKDEKPVCLCFVIQQTHKGLSSLKQMGIQEAKLLQLPTACNLPNASASNCPKLLGLPAGSPDNNIFTATSNATSNTSPSPMKDTSSSGFIHGSSLAGPIVISILHFVFST